MRRREVGAARRLEGWVAALLRGQAPQGNLASEEERRAAAFALRLHADAARARRAPRTLRERLLALPGEQPAATGRAPGGGRRLARRRLLPRALAWGAAAAAVAGGALYAWTRSPRAGWVPVGPARGFPPGSVRPVTAARLYAFVVHGPDGLTAVAGDCTDRACPDALGCPLQYVRAAHALRCPQHGALFDLSGHPLPGTFWGPLAPLAPVPLRVQDGTVALWVDSR